MKLVTNKYCASKTPKTFKTKPKKRQTASQLKCNGYDNIFTLSKTTSPLFGKRLWEMRHGRAVYVSVLHNSSWNVYLPQHFVNYLITQPIWLGVSWAQYETFADKVSIKEWIYDGTDTDHDCHYKRVTNWKHQTPNLQLQKNYNLNFTSSMMPLMFLRPLMSSVDGKVFKNYSKVHLESTKFENQCIKIGC